MIDESRAGIADTPASWPPPPPPQFAPNPPQFAPGPSPAGGVQLAYFAQPLWRLAVLSTCTFGVYNFYWFYRTWRMLRAVAGSDQGRRSPLLLTAGVLVPLLNLYLVYRLFTEINAAATGTGLAPDSRTQKIVQGRGATKPVSAGALTAAFVVLTALWRLPGAFWLLTFLSVGPLMIAQDQVNRYLAARQSGAMARQGFTWREVVMLIVGGVFLALALLGTLAGLA